MYSLTFDPFDKKDREKAKDLFELIDLYEEKEGGNANRQISKAPENENVTVNVTENIITHDAPDMQEAHDVHDVHDESRPNKTMEDAIHELGLGIAPDGGNASSCKLKCQTTLEKWYEILGYSDFKKSICAIKKAWPRSYKGNKWNRRIVKDVCFFVHYFHIHGEVIDFDILSECLSNQVGRDKKISPKEFMKTITQYNAGETTWQRYNTYLEYAHLNKLPFIISAERRLIEGEQQ